MDEAKQFLDEYEQAAKEMADKLVAARGQLKDAQHNMEHAALRAGRASDHAEQAATLAGIRSASDSMGIALGAMNRQADKDNKHAEALDYKAQLLKGTSIKPLEADANIAAALEASGAAAVPPAASLAERLEKLKKR